MRKIQAPISPPLLTQDRRFHLDIGLQQRRTTSGIRNEKSYYKDGSCMEKLPREAAKSASVEIKKKKCCGGIFRDVLGLFKPISSREMNQRPAEIPSKIG